MKRKSENSSQKFSWLSLFGSLYLNFFDWSLDFYSEATRDKFLNNADCQEAVIPKCCCYFVLTKNFR